MKNSKRYSKYKAKLKKMNKYGSWLKFKCPICNGSLFFYDKYDAICCISCDVWMSSNCGDPTCPFCSNRPLTPFEALYFENRENDYDKDWLRENYQHKNDGKLRHTRKRELYAKLHSK